ncbi:hypothetical protein [Kribbella sp. NPDC000426]|uniref:hypothetical protein n=1 Tax=Kribbella sp. NPDC000426 TaxID=3154255 RepID=UPI0033190014
MNDELSQSQELLAWLEQPPTAVPPAIPVTAPARLPFEALRPDDFERLVLDVTRISYEVEEARRYGEPGQKQYGIDLFGRLASEGDARLRYVTVQCRNVKAVSPKALGRAVEEFLAGTWASRSDEFVYATRASAQRTELLEAIENAVARLREAHVRFEVWDGERLSEVLRPRYQIVELYFGPATAAAYCLPTAGRTPGVVAAVDPETLPQRRGGSQPEAATERARRQRRSVVSRWKSVSPGDPVTIGLSNLKEFSSPHLDSPSRWDSESPSSVAIGIGVASSPLPARGPSTSQLRREFLRLLNDSSISKLLAALIPQRASEQWRSYNDVGRGNYAAVRSAEADLGVPSAWARLLLAEPDRRSSGLDPRCTYLLLHVDWTSSGTAVDGA